MKREDIPAFKSRYINAAVLEGKPVVLEIIDAPLETLRGNNGEQQEKTVLHFARTDKVLPLNGVNWDSVADICGDDTDGWPGHKIELYPTTTRMQSQTVPCVRVRPPTAPELQLGATGNSASRPRPVANPQPPRPAPPPPAAELDDLNDATDDLPFK
jgi:hypothetical protein